MYPFAPAIDDWRVESVGILMEAAMRLPRGHERAARMRNIAQDFGITLRTAYRYAARRRGRAA
jgi:hypothetical protein